MPIYKMPGTKDGLQKYRVRINYVDCSGSAKQIDRVTYGSTEAKDLESRLRREIKHEIPGARITVKQLFEEWKRVKKHEVRETTLDKASRILASNVIPFLGDVKLHRLNTKILMQWKQEIEKRDISLSTKQSRYSAFRTLLNYAVQMEYIPKNPLLRIGNFKSSTEIKKELDYYTADEFQKYIAVARQKAQDMESKGFLSEWDYYVFFAIAFYTGLRKGEINALQWNDISKGHLSVKRSIAQKLKGADRETPPKNKSSIRTLQLPDPLVKILNEHKKRWRKQEGFCNDFRVCGGMRCLRDTTIENRNKLYAQEAGIKKIRVHDFRHSHVSILANSGINIQEIARRLGHAKIEMTWNTYSHLYPREEERAIEILNKIV